MAKPFGSDFLVFNVSLGRTVPCLCLLLHDAACNLSSKLCFCLFLAANDKLSFTVNFHMAGIDSHFDTDISPLLVGMLDAFTAATADLDIVDDSPQKSPVSAMQRNQEQKVEQPPEKVRLQLDLTPKKTQSQLQPPATPADVFLTPTGKAAFQPPPLQIDKEKASLAELEEALQVQGRALVDAKYAKYKY